MQPIKKDTSQSNSASVPSKGQAKNLSLIDKYIKMFRLNGVSDPFDIDHLWDRAGGVFGAKQKEQQGLFLMEVLENNLRTKANRIRKESRFSHIRIVVSEQKIIDDHYLDKGWQKKALQQACEEHHSEDLQKFVAPESSISYDVVAGKDLAEDEVGFIIGHAVYVPSEDEKALFSLSIHHPSDDEDESRDWELVGYIYPQQRLTLINGDSHLNTLQVSGWPFGTQVSLLLVYDDETDQIEHLDAIPEDALKIVKTNEEDVFKLFAQDQELFFKVERLDVTDSKINSNGVDNTFNKNNNVSMVNDYADGVHQGQNNLSELKKHQSETWYGGVSDMSLPHLDIVAIALPRSSTFVKAFFCQPLSK